MVQRIQVDDDTDAFMDALDEYLDIVGKLSKKNRAKTKLYSLIRRLLRNVDSAGSAGGGGYS